MDQAALPQRIQATDIRIYYWHVTAASCDKGEKIMEKKWKGKLRGKKTRLEEVRT